MKRLFLTAALALGAAGCADDLRPIQVRNGVPLDVDCGPNTGVSLYAGQLDIALTDNPDVPQGTVRYLLSFNVASQLEGSGVSVGNTPVSDDTRNNFVAEEIELSYTSQPALTFATERVPAYLIIPAGSQDSRMNISLITPKALQTVKSLVDSSGSAVTLIATFKIKGHLVSGQSSESNPVSFPITVFNSNKASCPAGTVLVYNGPCGGPGGQDGFPITCEAPSGQ